MTTRSKIISVSLSVIGILVILFLIRRNVQREVSYYENGQLKHQVILKNSKYEGLATYYFESGKIQSKVYWKDGKKHGKSVVYFENGNVRQENQYVGGTRCCISKDYTQDGFLEQITELDSSGRIVDYYSYKKDGTRDFSWEKKDPIFIPQGDTLILGENYPSLIRLGNRQYDNIEVVIGNIEDPYIAKKNPPLPKKDSLTSIINIKADSLGLRKISGIVIERSATSDSLDVIPFTHRFYVKPPDN